MPLSADVDELLTDLLRRLRGGAVTSRPPAFLAATLRSRPIEWGFSDSIDGTGAGTVVTNTWSVHWDPLPDSSFPGNPGSNSAMSNILPGGGPFAPFPRGEVGMVKWVCTCWNNSAVVGGTAMNLHRSARFSVLHNGGRVPGYSRSMPQTMEMKQGQDGGAVAPLLGTLSFMPTEMAMFYILRAGDTLQVSFHWDDQIVGSTAGFRARVYGYRFPEVDAARDIAAYLGQ